MTAAATNSPDPEMILPAGLVLPDYDGLCIANVAGSVRRAFGLPAERALPEGLIPAGPFDCVILVVVDALGADQVVAHRGELPALGRVLDRGKLTTLTSVLPSTTTAALTSLLSGLTPQEHGLLGHTLYLREFAMLADLLRFHPAWLPGRGGLVEKPEGARLLFPVPTLYEGLAAEGVSAHALLYHEFIGSALSQVQLAGATRVPIVAASDLCVTLRRLVSQAPRPLFASAYWHAIDSLGHTHGPSSAETAAELGAFFATFETEFLDRLPSSARRGTLVLITADHGQVDALPEEEVRVEEHPDLWAQLLMPPAGDRRTAYLYAREGRLGGLRAALSPLGDRFHVLDSGEALAQGLFGRGTPVPQVSLRVGNLVALARGGATLIGPEKQRPATPMRGRHGGASAAEMEVPLLVLPLS